MGKVIEFDRRFTSAPRPVSSFTTAAWFSDAAHISAVSPSCDSCALTIGAAVEERRHHVRVAGARRRHQHGLPRETRWLASAPFASSSLTIAALPLSAASDSGLTP